MVLFILPVVDLKITMNAVNLFFLEAILSSEKGYA